MSVTPGSTRGIAENACPGAEVLERLAAGEVLDPAVGAHIRGCENCRLALDQARDDAAFLTRARTLAGPTLPPEGAPRIPGYGSIRLLSTGAQGVVYRAVQESTSRPVAIKVMNRPSDASSRQRHRAEREAEIAGRLRHPSIVTVFESRTLGDGRTAVIMEFVSGVAIDQWAGGGGREESEERAGDVRPESGIRPVPSAPGREVLRVFIDVCNAIHHAHLNGVIHRDLKPDNILVTDKHEPQGPASSSVSEGPRPVVLDFGIAKAGGIQATITGEFAGTPAYASPEQVAGKPEGVDGLTDVYSLGVILYRLVCGVLPYEVEGSIFDIARTISETEPKPPRGLDSSIPADLEAIILRALRKDKQARYQSAAALALDVERFLNGEPVEARSGSGWYLLRKAVAVNRTRLATVGVAVVLVVGVAVAIGLTLSHAAAVAKNAQLQHEQALTESTRARAVTELLRSAMPNDDPAHPEITSAVGSGLGRLYVRLETGAFADDPELDQTLRRLWGGVYTGFGSGKAAGMVEYAEVSLRNGLVRLRAQEHPEEAKIAATLHELAGVLLVRKRAGEAETACREALAIRERLEASLQPSADSSALPPSPDVAESHALLARILMAKGSPVEAVKEADAALSFYHGRPEREADLSLAAMTALKGRVQLDAHGYAAAEPFIRDALVRRLRHLPPHDPEFLASLSDASAFVDVCPTCDLATLLASAWQVTAAQAAGAIRTDLPILRGTDTSFFGAAGARRCNALLHLIRLQDLVLEKGDTSIVSMLLEVVHSPDGDILTRADAALRAADLLAARFGPNDFSVMMCVEEASTLSAFGGREDQAADLVKRAVSIWETVPEKARDPAMIALDRRYLGWFLAMGGRYDEAIAELTRAIDQVTQAIGAEHHTIALAESNLAFCLAQNGDLAAADARSLHALTLAQGLKTVPTDAGAHIRFARAHVLHLMGRHEEARLLFEQAWEPVYRVQVGPNLPWRRTLIEDVASDCEALGDAAAAARWRSELTSHLQDTGRIGA